MHNNKHDVTEYISDTYPEYSTEYMYTIEHDSTKYTSGICTEYITEYMYNIKHESTYYATGAWRDIFEYHMVELLRIGALGASTRIRYIIRLQLYSAMW